jgi:predicted O-linked N-acetylglucosamine transferase (SPINDLY family)
MNQPDGQSVLQPIAPPISPSPEEYAQIVTLYGAQKKEELALRASALIERYPLSAIAWKLWGATLQMLGRPSLAALQKAAVLGPEDADIYNFLGLAHNAMGQKPAAIACYRRALAINPGLPVILCNLASLLTDTGADLEAESCLRRALELMPEMAEAHQNLSALLKKLGRVDEAMHHTHMVVKIKPAFADGHFNLGLILLELNRREEAEICFRNTLALQPAHVLAHICLGNILASRGDVVNAELEYRQAIQFNPNATQAHIGLSSMFFEYGRLEEAEVLLRDVLKVNADDWIAHSNLGPILTRLGRLDEAVASFERALQLKPGHAIAYNGLAVTLNRLGRQAEGEIALKKALQYDPNDVASYSNLLSTLNFRPEASSEEILEVARAFDSRFCAQYRQQWPVHANTRDPGRRLRIGYVSPDFRHHAVAYFLEPILANHDKSQVEIFCYAEEKIADDFTARFRAMSDGWCSTRALSDDAMAQAIAADRIDIVVDLAGHSEGHRLLALARKPAPVQISYLGYPGTTGMAAIDYRIVDNYTVPPDMADLPYTESLLRMPDSLWCFRPTPDMPEPSPLPALKNGYLTFGSFNNFNKIDKGALELWAELLRNVPSSRLMMLTVPTGEARARLAKQFADLGVAAERLEFHGKLRFDEFHRKFLEVDISLDPLNVNGATTTCESLWMGVPVISLAEKRFLTRAGLSLLSAAGVPEFVARTRADYIHIAAELGRDPDKLADIRTNLRARLKASPLTNEKSFTRHLEGLYRDAWIKWCIG